ncbi:hypothetical protein [Sphingobium xenophagum]|nr:hypothetical protein [Sphingobium xenophagum]
MIAIRQRLAFGYPVDLARDGPGAQTFGTHHLHQFHVAFGKTEIDHDILS